VLFICVQNCESLSSKDVRSAIEFVLLSSDILDLTAEQLQYITDCILLRTNMERDYISARTNVDSNNKEKNAQKTLKMSVGVTTNIQLNQLARCMRVYFRNVFMRNALPISGTRRNGGGIVNLNDARGPGTHWVAYAKRDNHIIYFDSFGNLRPPKVRPYRTTVSTIIVFLFFFNWYS